MTTERITRKPYLPRKRQEPNRISDTAAAVVFFVALVGWCAIMGLAFAGGF